MTIAEIATTGEGQERRSRNDIKTILRASAIPAFNVIARSVISTRTSDRDEVSAGNLSLCEEPPLLPKAPHDHR